MRFNCAKYIHWPVLAGIESMQVKVDQITRPGVSHDDLVCKESSGHPQVHNVYATVNAAKQSTGAWTRPWETGGTEIYISRLERRYVVKMHVYLLSFQDSNYIYNAFRVLNTCQYLDSSHAQHLFFLPNHLFCPFENRNTHQAVS